MDTARRMNTYATTKKTIATSLFDFLDVHNWHHKSMGFFSIHVYSIRVMLLHMCGLPLPNGNTEVNHKTFRVLLVPFRATLTRHASTSSVPRGRRLSGQYTDTESCGTHMNTFQSDCSAQFEANALPNRWLAVGSN